MPLSPTSLRRGSAVTHSPWTPSGQGVARSTDAPVHTYPPWISLLQFPKRALSTNRDEEQRVLNGGTYPQVQRLLSKAGSLLITSGQRTTTARLTAVADDNKYVGRGWLPITGPSAQEAKAIAILLNSAASRLQSLRDAGRTLEFPSTTPILWKVSDSRRKKHPHPLDSRRLLGTNQGDGNAAVPRWRVRSLRPLGQCRR